MTILEKVVRAFSPANITLHCRAILKPLLQVKYPDFQVNQWNLGSATLLINGRALVNAERWEADFKNLEWDHSYVFLSKGEIVGIYVTDEAAKLLKNSFEGIPNSEDLKALLKPAAIFKEWDHVPLIRNTWDLIDLFSDWIFTDFQHLDQPGIIKGNVSPFTVISNERNVWMDKNVTIEDFVFINAQNGPVYIESGVYIESRTRLEGPLYIGKNARIMGGKVTACSIGPSCKIAGEISHTIVEGYSNKAHDGFIGHTYIGEWVNIGAGTITSNLKNNYGEIKVGSKNGTIPSGRQFLGACIGDHAKLGIATHLTAGARIGCGCSLSGSEIHAKYIPSFSWGSPNHYTRHDFDKCLHTIHMSMSRRGKKLEPYQIAVLQTIYNAL